MGQKFVIFLRSLKLIITALWTAMKNRLLLFFGGRRKL